MECPNCGLLNPPTAQRCDCGFDFTSRRMNTSFVNPAELKSMAQDPHPLFFPLGGDFLRILKMLYDWLSGNAHRRRQLNAASKLAERFGPPES